MANFDEALLESLAALERDVLEPVIAGEARSWCRVVQVRAGEVASALGRAEPEWSRTFKRIFESDPTLDRPIDALKGSLAELRLGWQGIGDQLGAVVADDRRQDADSTSDEPLHLVHDLREALLSWIVHCRAFVAEVRTWSIEAELRTRGVVD